MLEKDIVKTIDERGREQGVNSQPIVRDYIMGIAAAASNEVFKGETRSTDETPVIMGGIALRKGYFIDFPRYTTDIDFGARRGFFERRVVSEDGFYGNRLRDIGAITRDKVRDIYGTNAMPDDPIIQDVERRLVRNEGPLGSLRAQIRFPKIFKYQDIRVKMETNVTRKDSFVVPPREVSVLHAYPDAEDLKLGTITVEDIRKIHGDKVAAFTGRLSEQSNMAKTSRMKDLFDIWYISQRYPNDKLEDIFKVELQTKKDAGRNTAEFERVLRWAREDGDRLLAWLVELVKMNVKGLDGKSDDEIIRRMVLGLIEKYNFPPVKVLVENLVFELSRLQN